MTYLKAAIATTVLVLLVLLGFMFTTYDSNYEVNITTDAFLKGDYAKASSELNKLTETIPHTQWLLYKAYIERAEKTSIYLIKFLLKPKKLVKPDKSLNFF